MRQGYSLIEIMVVVALGGILLASAVPSYQQAVAVSYRHEARQQLYLQMQELITQLHDQNAVLDPSALLPSGRYRLHLVQQSARLLLQAEAIGAQQIDAECLSFWLDNQGQRGSSPSAACWEQ
jgi:prepilin-type N-terminal cleavage/methylation domain-containing protein